MNTSFWTWLAVAAVAGGVLLLLLATPANVEQAPLVLEEVGAEPASIETVQYWAPVTATPRVASYVPTGSTSSSGPACSSCGSTSAVVPATQPCGSCGSSQIVGTVCASCRTTHGVPCLSPVPSPCGATPCSGLSSYSGTPCGQLCPLDRPGINQNMDPCVVECTFVQLHTTLSHPICGNVCFEWTASKGSFLDAHSSDPIYYVPTTHFSGGEDVWVVLTMTDGTGTKYTDQMKLHVINLR